MIGGDLVVLNKERPEHNVAEVTSVIGEVEGKVAVMTDDIIDTAGTLVRRRRGAEGGGRDARDRLRHARPLQRPRARADRRTAHFDRVIVTDTVPVDLLEKPDNVEVLSTSEILAETIQNVFSDDSVSAIFAGENQLF